MKCIVVNFRHIITASVIILAVLILVLCGIFIYKTNTACDVFWGKDTPVEIISGALPTESDEDINLSFFKQNSLFTENESPSAETTAIPTEPPAAVPTDVPSPTPIPVPAKSTEKMSVNNQTGIETDLNELAQKPLPFKLGRKSCEVLIMHTHTTESYATSSTGRSTDDKNNMIAIGNVITDELNNHGIITVHDTTVHDYPSFNKAYTKAASTISENLKKYPDIKIVLDIHRDSLSNDDTYKLTSTVDGKTASKVMIVAGTDKNGLVHEHWRDNLTFAAHIQQRANELYPGLMRNLNLRKERFNQHLTRGSLIIEVGSNSNTVEEAKLAAKAFTISLISVLDECA